MTGEEERKRLAREAAYAGHQRKIDAVVGRHREAEYKNSRTPSP